ncbi:MAG TPA: hypothetical protein VIL39_00685 [Verrucomicrobiae bacterium]
MQPHKYKAGLPLYPKAAAAKNNATVRIIGIRNLSCRPLKNFYRKQRTLGITMKELTLKSLRLTSAGLSLSLCLLANHAGAAVQGWDPNGTTSIGGNGTWDTTSLNWTPGGTQTQVASGSLVAFTSGNAALFCAGPSGSANQGTFTVTVSGTPTIGGIFNGNLNPGPCNLTITGGGLNLATGTDAFSMYNNVTIINSPISGTTGGILNPQGSGSVSLFANNTYSGGTLLNSPTLVNFNNNNSFGTGVMTITRGSGLFAALLAQGGSTLTLANNFANTTSGGGINFASAASTPVVSTGTWSLGANNLNLRNNGNSTSPLALSGAISGTANLTVSGANGGKIILSGANTYSGSTTVGSSAATSITLQAGTANEIASSSSLIMAGGTFNPGGFDQAMASTTLNLTASSTIDFAAGASELKFANSSALTWTGILNLANWDSSLDLLRVGTDANGLTLAQLGMIEFNGASLGSAQLNSLGFVVVVPEPSTALLGLLGGLSLMWTIRHRKV